MNQSINTDSKNSKEPQQKYGQYKNTGGLKPVLQAPNLALSFYHGSKHTVVRSAWRFSNNKIVFDILMAGNGQFALVFVELKIFGYL